MPVRRLRPKHPRKRRPPAVKVPKTFGWRYVTWYTWLGSLEAGKFIWRNAITILSSISGIFAYITADPNQTYVSHQAYHYILIGNFSILILLAQIKRDHRKEASK